MITLEESDLGFQCLNVLISNVISKSKDNLYSFENSSLIIICNLDSEVSDNSEMSEW